MVGTRDGLIHKVFIKITKKMGAHRMCFLGKFRNKADEFLRKKLVSSLDLFPPLNSFPPFRSKEKLVSAETIQGNTVVVKVKKVVV